MESPVKSGTPAGAAARAGGAGSTRAGSGAAAAIRTGGLAGSTPRRFSTVSAIARKTGAAITPP
jgi:hypothetical protein